MARKARKITENGQVAVEYILLLGVGIVIWLLLMTTLVSRNPESPGIVIKKWHEIIQFIGQDRIENSVKPNLWMH